MTSILVANIYTEGRFLQKIFLYKKYVQILGVILVALFFYYVLKKNPMKAHDILRTSHEYVKYLPVDRHTSDFITPILDFTAKTVHPSMSHIPPRQEQRILTSGKTHTTKRSVSETKKKFVASHQGWKCGHCQKQLNAWFEVDHKIRLEHGGTNHVDNLIALCRECHGEKTAIENL
jgi:5-methylcytosine-specific restriction endonuclease McrA